MTDWSALYLEAHRIRREQGDEAVQAWFDKLPADQQAALRANADQVLAELRDLGRTIFSSGDADDE